jgi:Rrf2 family protein
MRLSPAAEFAVRGVIYLAEHHGEGPIRIADICRARSLRKEYLSKIFGSLVRADLITPVRGKGGGYMLAREPSEITVLEVVEAVEGPIVLNYCQHEPPQCDNETCRLRPMWKEIQQFVRGKLGEMTLADCALVAD